MVESIALLEGSAGFAGGAGSAMAGILIGHSDIELL